MTFALRSSFLQASVVRSFGIAAALGLAGVGAGCTVTATTTASPGYIVADWTIASGKDPAACTSTSTSKVRVDITDGSGTKLNSGSDTQDCTAFATSIAQSFSPGNYTVRVTMLAADGTERTTTATTAVTVDPGVTSTALVDFPLSSFKAVAVPPGHILADWTISGGKDPSSCTATSTATVRVDVVDSSGAKVNTGSDTQDCKTFATTITTDLAPGPYTVQVTMLAADGTTPRTTMATTSVTVVSAATATALIDFPLASFLP